MRLSCTVGWPFTVFVHEPDHISTKLTVVVVRETILLQILSNLPTTIWVVPYHPEWVFGWWQLPRTLGLCLDFLVGRYGEEEEERQSGGGQHSSWAETAFFVGGVSLLRGRSQPSSWAETAFFVGGDSLLRGWTCSV